MPGILSLLFGLAGLTGLQAQGNVDPRSVNVPEGMNATTMADAMFAKWDANKDDVLTQEECTRSGEISSKKFQKMDADRDGNLTREESIKFFEFAMKFVEKYKKSAAVSSNALSGKEL
eukprot:TRINITY_DN116028_c0_g1_i1.p1 TRINITY_DN116028_c0_g1~~TRINITY_DN116028_c0_g1_i1.p1  ORF type:complete len:118 (+),score=28.86 TRINITY_DN116028_c0_g1_i1:85-438(+)